MISVSPETSGAMTNFFISYTGVDSDWAEWIASILETAGSSVVIQAWDFRPGSNFAVEMQRAAAGSERTIAVLSPDYLRSLYAMAEWAAAFAADPDGTKGKLVPVLVREAKLDGLLAPIIYIKLVGLGEAAAREALLKGLAPGRARPASVPFPGSAPFPGASTPQDPNAAQATLESLPLEGVPKPGRLPVGSRMPWARNDFFVGREEDLKALARQLKAGETSAVGQVETAAATGLGGIGKTQLASEFVHRYGRFFAGGVFWMSFADPGAVPAEVAACGRSLNLHSSFDALTLEQQVRLVEEAWQSPLPRLLVFDNCEDEELLQRWRPRFGGSRVLVTSRRQEWDPTLGVKTVPLTTLPRPASIELLRRFRPDVPETEPALDDIANALGDLPLALHLAGSFLQTYRASPFGQPRAYVESLLQMDLLAHPSLQGRGAKISPTGHEDHVGRTFALSFERLNLDDETDALAIDLLARAAWFACGEPIPRLLLLKTVHASSDGLAGSLLAEDAIRRLIDLGLLESNNRNDLLMHRLVAAWARGTTKSDQARIAVEETILQEANISNETRNPALLLTWQPHLRTIADQAMERENRMAARLCSELGAHLWQAGDYSGARFYLERAVALHEKFSGSESQDLGSSLNFLGRAFHDQGDYSAALPLLERSLRIRENVLGPEHPDTAHSLNDIGVLLSSQGSHKRVRPYYERALAIREKVLGLEHPDTALSFSNLGSLFRALGNYEEARSYYERALVIREKVLGKEHPDIANSFSNLGSLFKALGNYEKARSYFERALVIQEKVLGAEHPDIAISFRSLGRIFQDLGDYKRARPYYERALVIQEKVLGAEHPNTVISFSGLGRIFQNLGDYERARSYYERALAIQEKVLGAEHPDTAISFSNLGSVFQDLGDYERARSYYERALAIQEKVLGAEHPDTAISLGNLGSIFQDLGDYERARSYYERTLAIQEKILGEENPGIATSFSNLGSIYQDLNQYDEARSYYERALMIQEKALGKEHPDIANNLTNFGSLLQKQGSLREALFFAERALTIREKVLGPEHPDTARSLVNLGAVLFNQGNTLRARWFLERALRIFTNRLGPNHPATQEARKRLELFPGSRRLKKQRSKRKS
jgi:tetratricopeptide (TPR) repeat protein